MSFLSATESPLPVRDPGQRPVEDELDTRPDPPAGHLPCLGVGVDVVVLDSVEARPGALPGPCLDASEDEITLAASVLDVEPVLVREHVAERLPEQAVPVASIEPDVPAVVGPEALRGARRHVADSVSAPAVNRVHRRPVDRVVVSRHPRIDVEIDVEDVGAHARAPAAGRLADPGVDSTARGEVAIGALELVLPASAGRRLPERRRSRPSRRAAARASPGSTPMPRLGAPSARRARTRRCRPSRSAAARHRTAPPGRRVGFSSARGRPRQSPAFPCWPRAESG